MLRPVLALLVPLVACSGSPVPAASPAGGRLVFLAEDPAAANVGAIVSVRPDGSERAELLRGAHLFPASVDPTGAWLAVVAVEEDDQGNHLERIRVYPLAGPFTAPTWESPPATQVRNPSFGPDGRAMAFESAVASFRDIYSAQLPAGPLLRLTDNEEGNYEPAFAPDGKAIAFVSSRDGNAEVYRMNADGGGQLRLTSFHLDDWGPQWAPNSQTIAFLSNREQIDRVFLMRPDGGDQRRLTADRTPPPGPDAALGSEPHETEPVFSPDGQSVVHGVRGGPRGIGLRLTPIAGGAQVQLSDGKATDRNPLWSPDGAFLVFVSDRDGGDLELYRIGADGQGRQRLTERPGADWLPRWARQPS